MVNTHEKKLVASEAVKSKTMLTLSSRSAQWCWLEEPQGGDQTHCSSLHSDPSRCESSRAALMPETQPRATRPPAPSHPVDGWSVDTVHFYGFYFEVLPVVQRVHSWVFTGATLTCWCCLPYNLHFFAPQRGFFLLSSRAHAFILTFLWNVNQESDSRTIFVCGALNHMQAKNNFMDVLSCWARGERVGVGRRRRWGWRSLLWPKLRHLQCWTGVDRPTLYNDVPSVYWSICTEREGTRVVLF